MNKNAMYGLFFVGLIAYYAWDTVLPEYEKWEEDIVEVQKNLSQARLTAPRLVEIRNQELELEEKLQQSLTRLPSGSELADLISLVIPVMEKVGISSNQIGAKSAAAEVEKEINRVHGLNFNNISGLSLANIINLIHELRNYERIINLMSYTITAEPSAEKKGDTKYTLNLNLETYSYIDDEAGQ